MEAEKVKALRRDRSDYPSSLNHLSLLVVLSSASSAGLNRVGEERVSLALWRRRVHFPTTGMIIFIPLCVILCFYELTM